VHDMTTSWPMADIRLYINHQFHAYHCPSWTSVRSYIFSCSSKKKNHKCIIPKKMVGDNIFCTLHIQIH
jgi:hypothetical protein